ncbi:hypothetical protein AgCh_027652 [Apium graveolens]
MKQDPGVLDLALNRDDKAISEALRQIHLISLSQKTIPTNTKSVKSYKEVLQSKAELSSSLPRNSSDSFDGARKEARKYEAPNTVFCVGFYEKALAKDVWSYFKKEGAISAASPSSKAEDSRLVKSKVKEDGGMVEMGENLRVDKYESRNMSLSVNTHTVKIQTIMSEEAENPTKPTKIEETKNTQIDSRYETIRVPIMRPSEYPIWKVKMTMFLEATDLKYLDRINEGPHKTTKLSIVVADQPAKTIPKEKSEYTAEDISSISKDAKVRHLLHSAIDNVMSNRGNRRNILVLDSGCSGYMTGNKALLSDFVEKAGPKVSYGDGNMGKTLGYGNINLGNVIIETVALVSGLKHNLLSVSQICDRGYHVDFFKEHCEVAKQRKSSFKSKTESIILEPYHLLHVDLFGPVNVMSITKKKYTMVIVDEFTRYTWVYFLHKKNETAFTLTDHVIHLDKLVKDSVKIIRSDNSTEFKNSIMEEFCKEHGIKHEFSAPGTPQQNGVVERKNRTLIEVARTMLDEAKLPTYFWAKAVQTTCFTQNATLINKQGKTPYEMVKKKKPNLKYFHVFSCKCFVLKTHPE